MSSPQISRKHRIGSFFLIEMFFDILYMLSRVRRHFTWLSLRYYLPCLFCCHGCIITFWSEWCMWYSVCSTRCLTASLSRKINNHLRHWTIIEYDGIMANLFKKPIYNLFLYCIKKFKACNIMYCINFIWIIIYKNRSVLNPKVFIQHNCSAMALLRLEILHRMICKDNNTIGGSLR